MEKPSKFARTIKRLKEVAQITKDVLEVVKFGDFIITIIKVIKKGFPW